MEYIARTNHHSKKKKIFQKEAPKLRSTLSCTTGRNFLVTADRFSLQELDVSKSDLILSGSKKSKASPKEQVKMNGENSYRQLRDSKPLSVKG